MLYFIADSKRAAQPSGQTGLLLLRLPVRSLANDDDAAIDDNDDHRHQHYQVGRHGPKKERKKNSIKRDAHTFPTINPFDASV